MEIGRHTAPAATQWRCLSLKGRDWRTWMGTLSPGLSVSANTAVRGFTLEGREATRTQPAEVVTTIDVLPHHSIVVATTTPKRW